jgi:hypothetical protein
MHKLSHFYKIVKKHIAPSFAKIGERDILCSFTNRLKYYEVQMYSRTEKIKKSFFPSTIPLLNSIDLDVRNSTSKMSILKLK